jgi:predicted nucleotide-binding protein
MTHDRIIVVHGEDETYLAKCCEVIRSLEMEPVCYRDTSNGSIIRALKSGNVKAALVLFPATDTGKSAADKGFKKRAAQQMVLELGALTALLGGPRVVVLRDPRVEPPANMHDAREILAEPEGEWEHALGRAVKALGDRGRKKRPYWRRRKPRRPANTAEEPGQQVQRLERERRLSQEQDS